MMTCKINLGPQGPQPVLGPIKLSPLILRKVNATSAGNTPYILTCICKDQAVLIKDGRCQSKVKLIYKDIWFR